MESGLRVDVSYVSYVSKVLSRRCRSGETTTRPQRCQMHTKLGPDAAKTVLSDTGSNC